MVSMSYFMLLSIFIIIILNCLSDKLFASTSSSSSGEFSCSLISGLCLCLPILAVSLYFTALVVKLINDIALSCNRHPSLSTTQWGRVVPAGGAIASPQADATWRGVLCLRKMASVAWCMTQHKDPGSCSFSSLPRATNAESPQTTLVHSALPLLDPRVRG